MKIKGRLKKLKHRIKRSLKREDFKLLMDVASCNLRCAMCPRGGISSLRNDGKGSMGLDLFKRIVDKFRDEKVRIREIEIGNWGEPLLNPYLPTMIRYVKDGGRQTFMREDGFVGISTNLNYLKDPDELLESGVDRVRVSISGMTQNVYGRNHKGGHIEEVLKNIRRLVEVKDRRGIKDLCIEIGFHDLIYNKKDAQIARRFCEENGLNYTPLRMYIPSVEDNIAFHRDRERYSKFYSEFIDLRQEIAFMKPAAKTEKCQFRRSVITVNWDGRLYRCCGVFEERNMMGPVFNYRIRAIPDLVSPICALCAKTPMSWR